MIRYFIIFLFPFLAIGQAGMFADFQEQASYEQANVGCTPDANEVHTQSNAISDPNCNESNATTGWASVGSTTTSVTTGPQVGSYHFRVLSNDGSSDRIEYDFAVTSGDTYTITFDAYQVVGTGARITSWVGFSNAPSSQTISAVDWETKTYNVTANITGTAKIRIYVAQAGATNDEIYLDNFSIIKTN